MPQLPASDEHVCPKCSDKMNLMPTPGTLPKYTGKGVHALGDPTPVISQSDVWTVEIYCCPNCRFVELYAD